MGIDIPSIKATVSDQEYRLITSVAGQNFGEELRLPEAALWLEEALKPETFKDAEAERAGSGQVCASVTSEVSHRLDQCVLSAFTMLLSTQQQACKNLVSPTALVSARDTPSGSCLALQNCALGTRLSSGSVLQDIWVTHLSRYQVISGSVCRPSSQARRCHLCQRCWWRTSPRSPLPRR